MCVSFGLDPFLASGSGDKTIVIGNFHTGDLLHQFEGHSRHVTCCAFSADGEYLASGSNDRSFNLWRRNSTERLLGKAAIQSQLHPMDEWTTEMIEEWTKKSQLTLAAPLTGADLLSQSDHQISELFQFNEALLQELSVLRDQHFLRQLTTNRSNPSVVPTEYLSLSEH